MSPELWAIFQQASWKGKRFSIVFVDWLLYNKHDEKRRSINRLLQCPTTLSSNACEKYVYGPRRKLPVSTLDHRSKIATLIAIRCRVHSSIRSQLLCVKQNVDNVFASNFAASEDQNHIPRYLKAFSLSGSRHAVSILSAAIRYGIVKSTLPAHFWLIFGISALEGWFSLKK